MLTRLRAPLRRALLPLAASLASCAQPSGPTTHDHPQRLLIAGTEDGAIVVDLDWRGIVRRTGPKFVSQGPAILSARNELITVGRLASDDQVVAGIDATSGLELWRVSLASGQVPVQIGGVQLGATAIAAHPTRHEIYLWRSVKDGDPGVAAFDYERRQVTRFYGPIRGRFRDLVVTKPTGVHTGGCLVVGLDANLGPQLPSRAFLNRACGDSYADRDSISIALPSRFVVQMELSADGNDLIVMTDLELLKYDAATLQLKTSALRPIAAPFFMSRATGRLLMPDVGSNVVASTGIIYLLDANLELSSIIDLRVLPFGKRPLGILGAEESRGGRWLYVVGGVPKDGPLYGPEQTHVLVIEKTTGTVVDDVLLPTFGGQVPYLVP